MSKKDHAKEDRKSVVQGKSVDLGGRRIIKKKQQKPLKNFAVEKRIIERMREKSEEVKTEN